MIINRELRDWYDANGNSTKELIVSYVSNDGNIKYLRYPIPESEMYEWEYSRRGSYNDSNIISFDNKPVRKAITNNGRLSDDRLYQILYDLNKNGQLDEIFKLNYPNTYFWDIEVEVDDSGFPDAESAHMPITVMSWVHYPYCTVFGTKDLTTAQIEQTQRDIANHCKTFNGSPEYIFEYKSYRNEVEMLYDFINNYLSKAPCVTGWNIFGYDYPYLYNRCKLLNINLETICPTKKWVNQKNADGEILKLPMHRLFYDYMLAYKTWDRTVQVKESNKLDFVGMATCGVQKVQHQLSLKDMWIQQPREYIFYNAIDSILVEQIDKKIKTSKSMFGLANLIKGNVLEAFSTIAGLHIVQNEYLWKDNKIVPKTMEKQSHRDYEGAYVFPPTPGVFKWVLGLDFASLYPTTQRQFNISPDTYLFTDKNYIPKPNEIKTASGAVFTKDFEGFLPKILTDFYAQRKMHKKLMKIAYQKATELEKILDGRNNNKNINIDISAFDGFNPYTCSIEELKDKIKEYKQTVDLENDLQMAVKIFINGIYGGMGCEFYKCYNPSIAEATTIQGQDLIKFASGIIDDYVANIWHTDVAAHIRIADIMKAQFPNFDVNSFLEKAKKKVELPYSKNANVYTLACGGDTDSAYISFDPLMKSCGIPDEIGAEFIMACNKGFLADYLKKNFDEYAKRYNCNENLEEFELEKVARTVIYIAKKNYVMDIAWKEPNVYLKPLEIPIFSGLEVVKGSTPPWCRDRMREFITWLLDRCNKNDMPEYSEIIARLKELKKLFALQKPDDICKSISISNYEKFILEDKNIIKLNDNIKTIPQHVLAAAHYNYSLYNKNKKYLKKYNIIHGGDKVKLYYTDKENVFVYLPYQFPIEFAPTFDVDTNFEKQMLQPLNRVITTCGYNEVPPSLTYSNSLW